jgi:hypothetical protein
MTSPLFCLSQANMHVCTCSMQECTHRPPQAVGSTALVYAQVDHFLSRRLQGNPKKSACRRWTPLIISLDPAKCMVSSRSSESKSSGSPLWSWPFSWFNSPGQFNFDALLGCKKRSGDHFCVHFLPTSWLFSSRAPDPWCILSHSLFSPVLSYRQPCRSEHVPSSGQSGL